MGSVSSSRLVPYVVVTVTARNYAALWGEALEAGRGAFDAYQDRDHPGRALTPDGRSVVVQIVGEVTQAPESSRGQWQATFRVGITSDHV